MGLRPIQEYLAHCRARGLAPPTVREAYGFPLLRIFLLYCLESGIDTLGALDRASLDRWNTRWLDQGGLSREQLSKFTVANYVRAINGVLKWARDEGANGSARAPAPRLPKHLAEVLSRHRIQQLENAATSERDKLIIRVLADTGLRGSERTSLRIRDITIRDRGHFLGVKGKGDRERHGPLPRPGIRLPHYTKRGRPQETAADRVFVGLRGRPRGDLEPLTRSGLSQLIRQMAETSRYRATSTPAPTAALVRHVGPYPQGQRGACGRDPGAPVACHDPDRARPPVASRRR